MGAFDRDLEKAIFALEDLRANFTDEDDVNEITAIIKKLEGM